MELTRSREELFGGDVFLTFEDVFGFEIELDFIFFVEELFEDVLFEELLFFDLLERILVILPRVVLVFLGLVFVVVFGIFLTSFSLFISELVILTLLVFSDSLIFVAGVKGDLMLILLLLICLIAGCVFARVICPMFLTEFWLRATLEISLALS